LPKYALTESVIISAAEQGYSRVKIKFIHNMG